MADHIPAWMTDELRESESLEIARLRAEIATLKARIASLEADAAIRRTVYWADEWDVPQKQEVATCL